MLLQSGLCFDHDRIALILSYLSHFVRLQIIVIMLTQETVMVGY